MWNTGAVTQSINVTTSGNYTVTVTSSGSGTAVSSPVSVTVNPLPTATISANGPLTFNQGGSVTLTASSGSSYLWSPGNQTTQSIVVTAGGSYTVKVTNSSGCSKISSPVIVTVNGGSQGVAFITPGGPTSFCMGGSVTLSANAGVSYIWSTGATTQSISAITSGSYVVTVTFTSNISTSSPVNVTVTNCSCPVPVNFYESSVLANAATLNWTGVTGVDSLQIKLYVPATQTTFITNSFSGTWTQALVGVVPNTTYRWRLRSICGSTVTQWPWSEVSVFTTPLFREAQPGETPDALELYQTETDRMDVEETVNESSEMNIYPNPASASATVTYKTGHDGTIVLHLMDFTGKIITKEDNSLTAGINKYALDLSNLAKGVYMVLINDNGKISTRKIVVN